MTDVRRRQRLERYARRGHKRMRGWLQDGGIRLIRAIDGAQKDLGVTGSVAEIGVYYGRLFILLCLLRRPGEPAVAIDTFGSGNNNFRAAFLRNLRRHAGGTGGVGGNEEHDAVDSLHVIEQNSLQVSGADVLAAGGPVRLFSVDGAHTADVIEHDLATARDSLAPGGVIIIDDYFVEEFPGVSEGTNRFFLSGGNGSLAPFAIGGNKVFLAAEDFAGRYIEALLTHSFPAARHEQALFGRRVLCYGFRRARLFGIPLSRGLVHSRLWGLVRATRVDAYIRSRYFRG